MGEMEIRSFFIVAVSAFFCSFQPNRCQSFIDITTNSSLNSTLTSTDLPQYDTFSADADATNATVSEGGHSTFFDEPVMIRAGLVFGQRSSTGLYDYPLVRLALDRAFALVKQRFNIVYDVYEGVSPTDCNEEDALGSVGRLYYQNNIQVLFGPACADDLSPVGFFVNSLKNPTDYGWWRCAYRQQQAAIHYPSQLQCRVSMEYPCQGHGQVRHYYTIVFRSSMLRSAFMCGCRAVSVSIF